MCCNWNWRAYTWGINDMTPEMGIYNGFEKVEKMQLKLPNLESPRNGHLYPSEWKYCDRGMIK